MRHNSYAAKYVTVPVVQPWSPCLAVILCSVVYKVVDTRELSIVGSITVSAACMLCFLVFRVQVITVVLGTIIGLSDFLLTSLVSLERACEMEMHLRTPITSYNLCQPLARCQIRHCHDIRVT